MRLIDEIIRLTDEGFKIEFRANLFSHSVEVKLSCGDCYAVNSIYIGNTTYSEGDWICALSETYGAHKRYKNGGITE